MNRLVFALVLLATPLLQAAEEDFQPLFNGKDLAGWVNVNCAPGTFTVREGIIVSTGILTGVMRTERMYENFILELEYKHLKEGGNAGLFVWSDALTARGQPFTRAIEVQILDGRNTESYTSHGDIFSIHGATLTPDRPHPNGSQRCLPSERRAKPAGEWNHYRVTCNGGVVKLAVNGKEVSGGSACRPRKGYICLEAEGSECHFRNLRLQELASTNATPEETATADAGFRSLYTGVDLAGWKADEEVRKAWQAKDWTLVCSAIPMSGPRTPLVSDRELGDYDLIIDALWKKGNEPADASPPEVGVLLHGTQVSAIMLGPLPPGAWQRYEVSVRGNQIITRRNGQPLEIPLPAGIPARGPLGLVSRGGTVQFANIYVREVK